MAPCLHHYFGWNWWNAEELGNNVIITRKRKTKTFSFSLCLRTDPVNSEGGVVRCKERKLKISQSDVSLMVV